MAWPVWIEPVLVAVGLTDDLESVAVLREAVDERDDAGGAREGVAPLLEREIRRDDRRALIVPAADDVVEMSAARVSHGR